MIPSIEGFQKKSFLNGKISVFKGSLNSSGTNPVFDKQPDCYL